MAQEHSTEFVKFSCRIPRGPVFTVSQMHRYWQQLMDSSNRERLDIVNNPTQSQQRMSTANIVKLRHERFVCDCGKRMHDTLNTSSVTQSVQVQQWLGCTFFLVRVCHVDPMFLVLAVSKTIHSFTDRNLNTRQESCSLTWYCQYLTIQYSAPVADPGGGGGGQSGHAPIQSDSLAINFEFDIRPKGVRPSIRCFFVFVLNKTLA